MILVDTDVMIDILRGNAAAVAWLRSVGDEVIVIPGLVVLELLRGARDKNDLEQIRKRLAPLGTFWPDVTDYQHATEVIVKHCLSNHVGIIDALIGVSAVRLGVELLTFNDKHFKVIEGLVTRRPYTR